MVKLLRGAGQPQMRAPIGLATAHAYALPASIAFDYPFATLRSGPYWHAMRRDLGLWQWNERRPPPYELPEGEFWVLLDAKSEDGETKLLDPGLGRLLNAIEAGTAGSLSSDDVEMLIEAGLTV